MSNEELKSLRLNTDLIIKTGSFCRDGKCFISISISTAFTDHGQEYIYEKQTNVPMMINFIEVADFLRKCIIKYMNITEEESI